MAYMGIDVNAMYNKALKMSNVTINYTDLMTDDEVQAWNKLHDVHKYAIRLSFVQKLIKNSMDRKIVPSIRLNDDRIFIK